MRATPLSRPSHSAPSRSRQRVVHRVRGQTVPGVEGHHAVTDVVEHEHASGRGGESEDAVRELDAAVQLARFQRGVGIGSKRGQRCAVVEEQPILPGADEQPTFVVAEDDRIRLGADRLRAGHRLERVALQHGQSRFRSRDVDASVQQRRAPEPGRGRDHRHPVVVPAEDGSRGLEHDPVGGGEGPPDIRKRRRPGGQFVDHRDELLHALCVGGEISDLSHGPESRYARCRPSPSPGRYPGRSSSGATRPRRTRGARHWSRRT